MAATRPGGIVLDPFFGSGTTGAVARKLGRHYIGLERDADYIAVAKKRIAQVQPITDLELIDTPAKRSEPRIPFGWLIEHGLLRSEAHTSEVPSLMRIAYAVVVLKKNKETVRSREAT